MEVQVLWFWVIHTLDDLASQTLKTVYGKTTILVEVDDRYSSTSGPLKRLADGCDF